jgi:hypothetical protein
MSNVPHLRNEEHLRKGGKKLLVAGVEAQCCLGRGLTVHHWPSQISSKFGSTSSVNGEHFEHLAPLYPGVHAISPRL